MSRRGEDRGGEKRGSGEERMEQGEKTNNTNRCTTRMQDEGVSNYDQTIVLVFPLPFLSHVSLASPFFPLPPLSQANLHFQGLNKHSSDGVAPLWPSTREPFQRHQTSTRKFSKKEI